VFPIFPVLTMAADALPPGWESWGIVGFLLFAIMGLSAAIIWVIKWKRDSERDYDENLKNNYVLKSVYEDMKLRCESDEKRCQECIYVNGDTLRKIHEILGEISASDNLIAQALAAVRQTIDQALTRGGN
jgi:hypothetical protein